jgi:signal transduction histidine kinase
MLSRLLIREKLNLLVLLPLLMVLVLLVPLLASRIEEARLSRATTDAVNAARQVSGLVQEVQTARLLSVAYLDAKGLPGNNLVVQMSTVGDTRARLLRDFAGTDNAPLLAALRSADLTNTNRAILARRLTDQGAVGAFGAVVDRLVNSLGLTRQRTAKPSDAWAMTGLDALLRANEASSRAGVSLLVAASNPAARGAALGEARSLQALAGAQVARFATLSTPSAVRLFQSAATGPGAQRLAAAASTVGLAGAAVPQGDVASSVFAAVQSQTTLRQIVEGQIIADVDVAAATAARTAELSAVALTIGAAALFLVIVLLSLAIGRSISVPLRRLTRAAGSVADVAEEELLRVADEDAGPEEVPRLAAIGIHTQDEIGDLAAAFNRVQVTAALLLERQIAGRRNVAAMFSSVGRRTTNLVGRQLALIDTLEQDEDDPDTLGTLYRLDHLSTRLRRNANSLVVISGGTEVIEGRPLSIADAVRAALGSVEDFQRVSLVDLPDLQMAPGAVADVVLLLAELVENAVTFSPPHTTVTVSGAAIEGGGCLVQVIDHGIGMSQERILVENARLKRRERLDLTPTDVLGLFVVGRIARRHGISVTLSGTAGRGLTAHVLLPPSVLISRVQAAMGPGQPAEQEAAAPGGSTAGSTAAAAPAASQGWFTRVQDVGAATVPGAAAPPEPVSGPLAVRVPGARLQRHRRAEARAAALEGVGWPPEGEETEATPPESAAESASESAPESAAESATESAAESALAVPESAREPTPSASVEAPAQEGPPDSPAPWWAAAVTPETYEPASAAPEPVPEQAGAAGAAETAVEPGAPIPLPAAVTPDESLAPGSTAPAGTEAESAKAVEAASAEAERAAEGEPLPAPAAEAVQPAGEPEVADEAVTPLARRMPGATLASLEAQSAGAPAPVRRDRVTIDPAETVQVILDVEQAVQRANTQPRDSRPISEERRQASGETQVDAFPLPRNGAGNRDEAADEGLRRRVPGAALADLESEPPRRRVRPGGRTHPPHPEQVRVWIEEFEAGVARAGTTDTGGQRGGGDEDGDSR